MSQIASDAKISAAMTKLGMTAPLTNIDDSLALKAILIALGNVTLAAGGGGTVTSVSFTGGLISVANPTTTPAFTVAGTSGGIPYFSDAAAWASSAVLAANALMVGGGAGAAPTTVTTGTGIITALGINVGSAGAPVLFNGALGTPSSGTLTNCTGIPAAGITGIIPAVNGGTGVANGASCTLTLPNAATTITMGGTIALGGFTLTVPATGTAALMTVSNTGSMKITGNMVIGGSGYLAGGGSAGTSLSLYGSESDATGSQVVVTAHQIKLGSDIAGTTAKIITAAGRITSDGVGSDLSIYPGNGRGAAGGSLILSTYDTGSTGVAGTLRTRLSITTSGLTTLTGATVFSAAGAPSTSAIQLTGALGTGGDGTTNLPNFFIQPSGATAATAWSTAGTAIGINLDTAVGNPSFVECRVDGTHYHTLGASGANLAQGVLQVIAATDTVALSSVGNIAWNSDVILKRKAAATLQLGTDAAGVTNQMLTAASRITSDGVGADLTIAPGNGRGAAGGTLILSTFTAAGAGAAGTLTTRMTIDTAGALAFPNVTAVVSETVVSDRTLAVSINGAAYKICLKA